MCVFACIVLIVVEVAVVEEMLAIVFASNTFKYVSSDLVGARPTAGSQCLLAGYWGLGAGGVTGKHQSL